MDGSPEELGRLIGGIRILVRMARVAEWECERSGITLPQYRALIAVAEAPRRASELAEMAVVGRPAVTALVSGLERAGLLSRRPVPGDRRGVHLEITSRGTLALERAEARLVTRFEALLADRAHLRPLVSDLSSIDLDFASEYERELGVGAGPLG